MNNILIPTDFSLNTLQFAQLVAETIPGKINIYLFHAFEMPDSLIDAMHRTGINSYNKFITEKMRVNCKKVKQKNNNIQEISFRVMYGTTNAAFRNFAEANEIDMIALPPDYKFVPVVRESVDPIKMFKKSKIEVLENLTVPESGRKHVDVNEFSKYSYATALK